MEKISRGAKKIQGHYGMKDYYKHYKKTTDKPVNAIKYNKVISLFNKELVELMLNENVEYNLPSLGLNLSIRKDKRVPKIVNGKLVNNSPVDWVTTKQLWDRNEEAKNNKVLVRYLNNHTSGYVFRIYLKKFGAKLKNRTVYKYKPARSFQRALGARIKDLTKDKFESFLLYNK